MKKFTTPITPLPEPLSGLISGTFAYYTITERFPKIVKETLAANDFPRWVVENLESLIAEIPLTALSQLDDPAAADKEAWQRDLTPYLGKNWLEVPWFFAEMYFYRRIIAGIGFHGSGEMHGYDPFLRQKERLLTMANDSIARLGDHLEKALYTLKENSKERCADLQELLVSNVWGNQGDLSMWSADDQRPDHQDKNVQRSNLLVDDSEKICNFLMTSQDQAMRVDFILDNYGPELVHDIGLADYLLSANQFSTVRFHAKPTPHYVSDAMIKDVHSTLKYLAERPQRSVQAVAERVNGYLQSGRLELTDDYFWTSPLYFWEMPESLRQELGQADLVISKGDANYRRLAGDLTWPPTTAFNEVMRYFPTSLLALRVLKAELALGLSPQQVKVLDEQDPDWRFNGNWAVIQLMEI